MATATALASAVGNNGSIIALTYSGCPNIAFGNLKEHPGCDLFNSQILDRISELNSQAPVFLVSRSMHYIENKAVNFSKENKSNVSYAKSFTKSYSDMACAIRKKNHVFLVNPIPEMPVNVPRYISHSLMTGNKVEDIYTTVLLYKTKNKIILDAQNETSKACDVKILEPTNYLCRAGICYGSQNLQPLYFDDNHMSESGNKILIPMFKSALN
ncbi:hypothetical protein D3C80_1248530 [compost metagenome]